MEWEREDRVEERERDRRETVKAFFNPAERMERREDWAADPIRLTDSEESMEGRMEEWNRERLRNSWPSVMEITLVAMNSERSLLIVSRMGMQDSEPRSDRENILANRSRMEEWTLNMLEGKTCRAGIEPRISAS